MRRMFADVDADFYIMADGDGTYDGADAAPLLNALRDNSLDMMVGRRKGIYLCKLFSQKHEVSFQYY